MEKKELQVIALSSSESSQGNFVLVLEETESKKRLPIIIGIAEAQSIAVFSEHMLLPRPLTHDLFKTTLEALKVMVQEIIIYELLDTVFYTYILLRDAYGTITKVDARASDAIAIALRVECPIYIYDFVLEKASVAEAEEQLHLLRGSLAAYSIDELEALLKNVLAKEDYESAARLRDFIERRKKSL